MRQRAAVVFVDGAPSRELVGQRFQLAATHRRQQVTETVVVADVRMLVVRRGISGLRGEVARALDDVGAVRYEHAAAARGDDLVAVEREGRALAEGAGVGAA